MNFDHNHHQTRAPKRACQRPSYRRLQPATPAILRWCAALALSLMLGLALAQPAAAAEFASSDSVYILAQGEVVTDDLYVFAPEIIINGTVEGDLLATGGYIEINGAVNGSVMAAGGGVQINGVVQNSVRAAGINVTLNGTVRQDFLAAAGFGGPGLPQIPIPIGGRTFAPGIQLTRNSAISGDTLLTGSTARAAGIIGGNLLAAANRLEVAGRTDGNADLRAESLLIQDDASVGGTLTYTTRDDIAVPAGTAATVVAQPWESAEGRPAPTPVNPIWRFLGWLWRLVAQLLGLVIVAWLLYTFAPRLIRHPVNVIEARPVEAGLYGFATVVIVAPLLFALIFLATLFWGWFPGGFSLSAFGVGLLSIAWLLSPVITGLWVGRRLVQLTGIRTALDAPRSDLQALLLGIVAIVLVASIVGLVPCVGLVAERIIYLLSLALAVGGIVLARLRPAPATTPALPAEG